MSWSKAEILSWLILAAKKWPEISPVVTRIYRDLLLLAGMFGLVKPDEAGVLQTVAFTPEEAALFAELTELCSQPNALFSPDEIIEFIGAAVGGGVRGQIAMVVLGMLISALKGEGKSFLDQLAGKG